MPPRIYENKEQKFCSGASCKNEEQGINGRWKYLDQVGRFQK